MKILQILSCVICQQFIIELAKRCRSQHIVVYLNNIIICAVEWLWICIMCDPNLVNYIGYCYYLVERFQLKTQISTYFNLNHMQSHNKHKILIYLCFRWFICGWDFINAFKIYHIYDGYMKIENVCCAFRNIKPNT